MMREKKEEKKQKRKNKIKIKANNNTRKIINEITAIIINYIIN